MTTWRLLQPEQPASGIDNMALDEALLLCRERGDAPILRIYAWSQETISIGRFQSAADVANAQQTRGAALVRRITSGGAIIHRSDEVTYALIAPYSMIGDRHPRRAYQRVHAAIACGLAELGIGAERRLPKSVDQAAPFCFDRVSELDLVSNLQSEAAQTLKLVGSAQRRAGSAFLQHGSIPLSDDGSVQRGTSVNRILGRSLPRQELVAAVISGLATSFGADLEPSTPRPAELARAAQLAQDRYSAEAWTLER